MITRRASVAINSARMNNRASLTRKRGMTIGARIDGVMTDAIIIASTAAGVAEAIGVGAEVVTISSVTRSETDRMTAGKLKPGKNRFSRALFCLTDYVLCL